MQDVKVCTYRRVRLVNSEKEYSWISRMKLELRFLQKRVGLISWYSSRDHTPQLVYACYIAATVLTMYESLAKNMNSVQSVHGEVLDHRSLWYRFPVCRGNHLGMCRSPEAVLQLPSAGTPATGGRWVFQRSLKLYNVVYFSLCPIWNG